ncbi:VWA domain-containing protein [Candidatus Bipolaricaulota bacterium]|nr:VWA domain-containing protein [Candidatus Bipolaricaulota bacterium]
MPQAVELLVGRPARVGVIGFAETAQVLRPPEPLPLKGLPTVSLSPWGTDMAAAVDLALALLPEGPGELVLLTDGRATGGDLKGALARARARGVPIHVLPVGCEDPVRLVQISSPEKLPPGEVRLSVEIFSLDELRAEVLLARDGEELVRRELELSPGVTSLEFSDHPPGEGVYDYTVCLSGVEDPVPENDVLHRAVMVGTPPPVLLVGPAPSALDAWLASAGIPARRVATLSPADLAGTRLVVLDDLPLASLSPTVLSALRGWVAAGGGLLALLGRQATEGYVGPAEELLPVSFSVPEGVQEATVAIAFVLDRSSSMAGRAGALRKIDLLKEAVAQAVEVMRPQDLVAAVAFDRDPHWLVGPAPVEEVEEDLYGALKELTPSGGTDLYPAVEEALAALAPVEARLKHIILVSDGRTVREGRDFSVLYEEVAASGVGLTAIAVGKAPDTEVLAGLSRAAGGSLLLLSDIRELPQVLIRETQRVVRPRYVEGRANVKPGPAAPALGLSRVTLPPLSGYTLTFPKPHAQVALVSEKADPVLALAGLGLGQVAALTCDLSGGWSGEWLSSPGLDLLLSELVSRLWSQFEPVTVSWAQDGGELLVTVDVVGGGRWVNGLDLAGVLTGPVERELSFSQVAPGRYVARAPAPPPGGYLLVLSEPGGRHGGSFPLALPYPPELSAFGPDVDLLRWAADFTGGSYAPDELLPPPPHATARGRALARGLLWAAAGAFLADLVLRKLLA